MAESSFPWEDIDTTETQYSTLFRTLNDGVKGTPTTDDLEVVAGFVGLTVDVEPGQGMVQGHYYVNTVAKNIELETADPVNDRIDTIVLRLDDVANEIVAVAVTGEPSVSPVPPTLTQTEPYGVYEFPLADVLVEAGAGTPGTITDRRQFMGERFGVWSTANRPDPGTGVAFGYNTTKDDVDLYDGNDWSSIIERTKTEIFEALHPVGSIYTNATNDSNPATLLGFGTWEAFGAGRVPVGFNAGETEFDAAEKTGGAKTHTLTTAQIPSHTHTQNSHNHSQNSHGHQIDMTFADSARSAFEWGTGGIAQSGTTRQGSTIAPTDQSRTSGDRMRLGRNTSGTTASNNATTASNQNTGGGGAHNNLQPYITVYMWKRTA